MYMLGGRDADYEPVATVEVFNPVSRSWRSLPPMSTPRSRAVCGVVGGSLIVAGGYNREDGELTSAEAFTPATGWTPLPPMPHAAFAATALSKSSEGGTPHLARSAASRGRSSRSGRVGAKAKGQWARH